MSSKRPKKPKRRWFYLFILLVIIIVIGPIFERYPGTVFIVSILFTLLLFSALYAELDQRRTFVTALIIGIPYIVVHWINVLVERVEFLLLGPLLSIIFFGYIILNLLRYLLKAKRVTANMLFAAISVYLLIGFEWTNVYIFIERLAPGSFIFSHSGQPVDPRHFSDLVYYSFTTLTTLGYGDVYPASDFARTFAILEAITGVLYSAVIIARLVGIYIVQSMEKLKE